MASDLAWERRVPSMSPDFWISFWYVLRCSTVSTANQRLNAIRNSLSHYSKKDFCFSLYCYTFLNMQEGRGSFFLIFYCFYLVYVIGVCVCVYCVLCAGLHASMQEHIHVQARGCWLSLNLKLTSSARRAGQPAPASPQSPDCTSTILELQPAPPCPACYVGSGNLTQDFLFELQAPDWQPSP